MSFYSIYIPDPLESADPDDFHVFEVKEEAFALLKSHKEARLKIFLNNADAIKFSQNGYEPPPSNTSNNPSSSLTLSSMMEKSPYRGPKSQDLVIFRKNIEQGKIEMVLQTIWQNPRYLIGSGDTPTILKESFRYNALHSAALAKNGKMCEALLNAISDPKFIQLLYGKKNSHNCQEVSNIMLDLYLNMPEKGRNETPLHLASKYGAVVVVEVLTSYPQCCSTPNSEGLYPRDIICTRANMNNKELIAQITELLEERFYVPVIRSVDNSMPPIIGEPFSPTNPPNLVFDPLSPEMEIQAYAGPMNKDQAQSFRKRWKTPPRLVTSPQYEQRSPGSSPFISPIQLRKFTPNKMSSTPNGASDRKGARRLFPNNSEMQNIQNNNSSSTTSSLNTNKSNENSPVESYVMHDNINSDANSNNVLTNMGPPRVPPIPIKSDLFKGYRDRQLSRLIDNLDDSNNSTCTDLNPFDSPMYKERHLRLTDTEKGLEVIGRELASEKNVKWNEYWTFLDEFIDMRSTTGLTKLENYLGKCAERKADDVTSVAAVDVSISNLCDALNKLEVQDNFSRCGRLPHVPPKNLDILIKPIRESPLPSPVSPNAFFNAFSCAEKSWQVYAKRLTNTILNNQLKHVTLIQKDAIKAELKRLSSLVASYKEDKRFSAVDFDVAHSRFAHLLVVYVLQHEQIHLEDIRDCLRNIHNDTIRNQNEYSSTKDDPITSHMQCLIKFLLKYFNDECSIPSPENISTEQNSENIWTSETACKCDWHLEVQRQNRHFKRMSRRNEPYEPLGVESVILALTPKDDWQSSVISDSDDDDEFLSDSGSDDDIYYTPPESLSSTPELKDSLDEYKNYLLGEEPTKTDVDVLNAILTVDIEKSQYPLVYQWRAAVLQHSAEERNGFPSPSVVVKGRSRSNSKTLSYDFSIRSLFQMTAAAQSTSIKPPSSPVKKNNRFSNFIKPSTFSSITMDNGSTNAFKNGSSTSVQLSEEEKEQIIVAKSPTFHFPASVENIYVAKNNHQT